jgi:CRISPR/Cas system-associated exonuclease Cas4 (RecB family)
MTYSVSPWSFSKIKAFEQCPKQFYHMKIAKDYIEKETEAMLYGTLFHEAAENFVKDDTPIPEKFKYAESALTNLKNKPGKKLCEYKLGLTEDLEPCGFFDENVWFRGIADLIILDSDTAWVVDYKTGKSARYADKGQLELMALATFKHFPEIKKVKAGLLFVIAKTLVKDSYEDTVAPILWKKWLSDYARMEKALETNTWNPRPSGLCRQHCAVIDCPHNGRN